MPDKDFNPSRLSSDDLLLVQALGSRLRSLIGNREFHPIETDRRDELGILAMMVNRVAIELRNSRRQDEQRRRELEQRIEELNVAATNQQRLLDMIKELSTPILSIYDGVLLLPMIGALDTGRTQHMIGALLAQVSQRQAQVVILDITGVPVVDTQVANVLLQAAQATELLGARVILCGISPSVAQVVISLGIDLSGLLPCSDLQAAIALARNAVDHRSTTH